MPFSLRTDWFAAYKVISAHCDNLNPNNLAISTMYGYKRNSKCRDFEPVFPIPNLQKKVIFAEVLKFVKS